MTTLRPSVLVAALLATALPGARGGERGGAAGGRSRRAWRAQACAYTLLGPEAALKELRAGR